MIYIVFAFLIYLYLVELIDYIKKNEQPKQIQPEEDKKKSLWDSHLLVVAGLERPIEYCELEDVTPKDIDCPLDWRIDWNGEGEGRTYETIDITNYKLLE